MTAGTMNTECDHKETDHVHGTHACYVLDQCRCEDCRRANSEYGSSRRLWLGEFPRQDPPLVDAQPARDIVTWLTSVGIGLKTISSQSGVSHGTLWKLMYGRNGRRSRRVRRETLAKLEEYKTVAEPAAGAKVPAAEAWLIIAELQLRGWTMAAIGRRVHGPSAVSLQLSKRQVVYGNVRILRNLLSEPVPPRRSRHGEHPVESDHQWRTWRQITDPLRQAPSADVADVEARRILTCRSCGRPLTDHDMLERCA